MTPLSPRARVLRHVRRALALGAMAPLSACEVGEPVVCDPLPAPLACDDPDIGTIMKREIGKSAAWAAGGDGLYVDFHAVAADDRDQLSFAGDPLVTGATVARLDRQERVLALELVPDEGTATVEIRVSVACDGLAQDLLFRLDTSGEPAAGASVPVTTEEATKGPG